MRELHVSEIIDCVEKLCIDACYYLEQDVEQLLVKSLEMEESAFGRTILSSILENARIARERQIPICQDTGTTVVFLELGQDVHITGGYLYDAINEGVRRGYIRGYLRKSILSPLKRENTGDNTPAIIHTEIVPGDKLKIIVAPKGGGSENMSALKMLKPSDGIEGIKEFVVESVVKAGGSACPPLIVGVGIGGNMERVAYLAKRSLLRKAGSHNPDPEIARLETELLCAINNTGIGPQGLGGRCTALAVHIEAMPTHIASLPVAVNLQCHAARHKEAIL